MRGIPSADDFERADRLDRERSRNLDLVVESVKRRFQAFSPLYDVYVLPQADVNFRAYIFFRKRDEVEAFERSGVSQTIREAVFEELERFGRGRRPEVTVAFEFDSDENVRKNFQGNYYLRLL